MQKRDRTPVPYGRAPADAGISGNGSKGPLPPSAPLLTEGRVVMTLPFELPKSGETPLDSELSADLRSVALKSEDNRFSHLRPPAPLPSLTDAFSRRRAVFGVVEIEPGSERPDALVSSDLALAQVRHARRALEGALEHGASLLAALGLPRLVEPGFVPIDPMAAGDAIETAIAALDAMDAPLDDIEDSHDAEHDTSDAELDLGWNETVSQLALGRSSDDGDETALERAGRGFIRSGPDDHEPSLGAPEPHFGRHEYFFVDQTHWISGGCDDLELGDDNGVADDDGLQEQFAGSGLIPTLAWSVGGYVG